MLKHTKNFLSSFMQNSKNANAGKAEGENRGELLRQNKPYAFDLPSAVAVSVSGPSVAAVAVAGIAPVLRRRVLHDHADERDEEQNREESCGSHCCEELEELDRMMSRSGKWEA